MDRILLLDTSVGSQNKGDDIIMECTRKELQFILKDCFEYTLPTHVSPFHWYQVWRNSNRLRSYANCKLKFVGGSNILVKNLLTHYPQWNINLFNYQPLKGCILVGVGAGAGEHTNAYTRYIYRHLLNHEYYHSVRDERSREYVESLGLKAINTGCVTMWMLTPEFCRAIPTTKSSRVVFTVTASRNPDAIARDRHLLSVLRSNYDEIYFWPQGIDDMNHLKDIDDLSGIHVLQASKQAYDEYLTYNDTDYVGSRLHGGVYAMRHGRRAIIIAIDERAREIHNVNHLNCVEKDDIAQLADFINSDIVTDVRMNYSNINRWKAQFN